MTDEQRNIVLLCLDSLRKDIFDEHCSEIHQRTDIHFEQCRAASSWSVPSHASMLTGKLPSKHGIHTYNQTFSGLDISDTFLGHLDGYRTLGVSANVYAGSAFEFNRLFDEFVDITADAPFPDGLAVNQFLERTDTTGLSRIMEFLRTVATNEYPVASLGNAVTFAFSYYLPSYILPKLTDDGARRVVDKSLQLVNETDKPFFLFANIMDAHGPHRVVRGYDDSLHSVRNQWDSTLVDDLEVCLTTDLEPYEDYILNYRQLYRAAADYVDRIVGEFLDDLQTQTSRETTIVITADHGENLGYDADEGMFEHKMSLSEGLLHVPCVVVNPPSTFDTRHGDYLSHLRLGELLVGLANGEVPDLTQDQIAAELIGIGPAELPADVDADYWNRMMRCAYEREQKVVWDSTGQTIKYRLDFERPSWQQRIGSGSIPSWPEDLFDENIKTYRETVAAAVRMANVNEDTRGRLKDLGYL